MWVAPSKLHECHGFANGTDVSYAISYNPYKPHQATVIHAIIIVDEFLSLIVVFFVCLCYVLFVYTTMIMNVLVVECCRSIANYYQRKFRNLTSDYTESCC